jgi:hypothetical protein
MDGPAKMILNPNKLHSLDPKDHNLTNDDLFVWRNHLREKLLQQRRYVSDYSGEYLTRVEMHEGILTRANVPRNVWWHILIYHPYNSFLLLPDEHRPKCPSRQWCVQKAYERYGREAVRDWFYELPWRGKPHFQLL